MTYEIYKATQSAMNEAVKEASDKLQSYPRGNLGMTPDSVKFSPEFQADKGAFDTAFQAYRNFNQQWVKVFKKEDANARKLRGYGRAV